MTIFDIVLPVFLVIGLGYLLRVRGFLTDTVNAWLSRLVFYVTAPALLFRSMSQHTFDWGARIPALIAVGVITAIISLGVYALARGMAPARRGVLAQACHRSNTVFIGLPLVLSAYGEEALAVSSLLIGFMVIVENFFGVLVLTLPHKRASERHPHIWTNTALRVAKNPLILACAAGALYSVSELRLPVTLDRSLALLGDTAAPLGLLSVGASLEFRRLRDEMAGVGVTSFVRLIVNPALVYFALRWLGAQGPALGGPVLIMGCPTAVVSYIMAREMDGDSSYAAALIIGTTVFALPALLAWLAVLRVG